MQEVLTGETTSVWTDDDFRAKGNLVEVLSQIGSLDKRILGFLQEEFEASTLIDYGSLLSSYMLGHWDSCGHFHDDDCVLEQLLRHGADPNPKGSWVMPLQIAVYSRDVSGVRSLLNHGADPNNTGDPQGVAERNSHSLTPFHLHGVALAEILHSKLPDVLRGHEIDSAALAIRELLGLTSLDGESGPGGRMVEVAGR